MGSGLSLEFLGSKGRLCSGSPTGMEVPVCDIRLGGFRSLILNPIKPPNMKYSQYITIYHNGNIAYCRGGGIHPQERAQVVFREFSLESCNCILKA